MAQFTHSLCEEVIRTEGGCGLTRNEITQMARLALRTLKGEKPYFMDAMRYRCIRETSSDAPNAFIAMRALDPAHVVVQFTGEQADRHIDAIISGSVPPGQQYAADRSEK